MVGGTPEVGSLSKKLRSAKPENLFKMNSTHKLVSFLMNVPHETRDKITVELKNGTSVKGMILNCSPTMNLSLENVSLVVPNQDPEMLQFMNIRGNQIRQIILPDDLNIDHVLEMSMAHRGGKNTDGKDNKDNIRGGRGRGGIARGGRGGRITRGRGRGMPSRGRGGSRGGFSSRGSRGITGSNSQPLAKRRI